MREIKSGRFMKGHKKVGGFGKGDRHTEQAKEKVRLFALTRGGEKAGNWRGGVTEINTLVRCSRQSREWRKTVFERDNYTCQDCGAHNGNGTAIVLNVDHIKPFAYFPELRFELSNGRTLCRECHKLTDSYAGRAVRNYA